MTQDFANKSKKTRRGGSGARKKRPTTAPAPAPWPWFIAGLFCGVFLAGLVWLALQSPVPAPNAVAATPEPKEDRPTPRFDFYTLLPEQRIDVELEPDTVATETAPVRISQYLLQAGSFKQAEDADRRRAELILLGLDASVEAADVDNGQWYRVYIGPFESRSRLQSARSLTAQQGIDTLLLKRPAG
ncbi:MAG: SPOR domain-containing protein [Pseudomonadota bacterium]